MVFIATVAGYFGVAAPIDSLWGSDDGRPGSGQGRCGVNLLVEVAPQKNNASSPAPGGLAAQSATDSVASGRARVSLSRSLCASEAQICQEGGGEKRSGSGLIR